MLTLALVLEGVVIVAVPATLTDDPAGLPL